MDSAWEQEKPEARKTLYAKRAARRKAAVPNVYYRGVRAGYFV